MIGMLRGTLGGATAYATCLIVILGSCALPPAFASESNVLPVPAITIYPGDAIKDNWLVDRDFGLTSAVRANVIVSRDLLVGKIARRTLLPGAPVPSNAVSAPKIVANGAKVRIVFAEGGLTIATYGAALQDGSVGDIISLRNLETGLTVSGIVQADGTILLSGG
ncbi:flagellar basal body P-ring formation chaperone FlgA [Methylocella tundrae]|nr:flagellar basal body P-ring formation chaperone FlgA [Methylocella tundrae]